MVVVGGVVGGEGASRTVMMAESHDGWDGAQVVGVMMHLKLGVRVGGKQGVGGRKAVLLGMRLDGASKAIRCGGIGL